ncbi:hypothetical protein KP509_1Z067600 [Ceratopteris richardii]|nr:hypothetical protein KP509_1Z067600 [Ceratopteris richardii]
MVPEAVEDQNSPAWNENGLWNFDGCKSETALEYKRQFERDFSTFMAYRSQELLSGGLLFCVMIASNRGVEGMHSNNLYENLQKAWRELISEGLLSQESLDTFNLPLFLPTLEEVKEMVEEQKEFEVLLVEYVAVERAPANAWKKFAAADGQMWGNTIQTMTRNFMGGLLEPHLGVPKFEMLMQRVKELAAADDERFRSSLMGTIVLALIRK